VEGLVKARPPGTIRLATPDDLDRMREIAIAAWTPIHERFRLILAVLTRALA
jgi:hypothetical protein